MSWDILVGSRFPGFTCPSIPPKNFHIHFGDFIIPKNKCFFLKHRKLYISWIFFTQKKTRNPFVRTQFQPTFFPPKNHPKSCGLPSGGPTGFTPLLGYPNHFASRQLKWCRPGKHQGAHGRPTDSVWFGWGSGRPNIWSQGSGSNTSWCMTRHDRSRVRHLSLVTPEPSDWRRRKRRRRRSSSSSRRGYELSLWERPYIQDFLRLSRTSHINLLPPARLLCSQEFVLSRSLS